MAAFFVGENIKSIAINDIYGEKGSTNKFIRPTLDVNGIWGGYTGEGKTVITKHLPKISMRLVQEWEEITELFKIILKVLRKRCCKVKVHIMAVKVT
jgi:hypothetical protein